MTTITDEALEEIITTQLPRLLEKRPDLDIQLHRILVRHFIDRGEWGKMRQEMAEFRSETQESFKQVNQRFGQVEGHLDGVGNRLDGVGNRLDGVEERLDGVEERLDGVEGRLDGVEGRLGGVENRLDRVEGAVDNLRTEMRTGFKEVYRAIDRLGQRWGIRNESLFRETMTALLEQSFGVQVETRHIGPNHEQFDIIITNGDHILIEIAASVKQNIVGRLQRKQALYIQETGVTPARFILAVGAIHSRRAQSLREAGFEVIEPEDDELD